MDAFYEQQETIFTRASKSGLPPFPQDIAKSTSGNATPYVASLPSFRRAYATDPIRARLLDATERLLGAIQALSVQPVCLLVGGSFLVADNSRPEDIDCICFYAACGAQDDFAEGLARLLPAAHRDGVDVRFVPIDSDPILALKACAFFSVLYSRTRASANVSRGTVLVRLDDERRPGDEA